jgi:hypothetical protein
VSGRTTELAFTPDVVACLRGEAAGFCERGVWYWIHDFHRITTTVNKLMKRGYVEASYYTNGRAAINPTDKGREALLKLEVLSQ